MSPIGAPAVATTRPPRGEAVEAVAGGSTVPRAGRRPVGDRSVGSYGSMGASVVHEFTSAWERGEAPALEAYLRRVAPGDHQGAVELIYRDYCLAEADGRSPDTESYIARFPGSAEALRRLFRLHGACSPSLLARLMGPPPDASIVDDDMDPDLPEVGDAIGPYRLRRELGRGSFARVFLAEQTDLADRLVVVKIATRWTREPWLLARARHAHIVEIVSHAEVDDGAFHLICMPFWGGATLADVLAACPASGRRRGPKSGRDLLAALDAVAAPEFPTVHPARPAREILAPLSYDRAVAWVIARLAEALDHAFGRDVAHGDVKPSNILLTADGSPMLLDFNLARDGEPTLDPLGRPIDPGGTPAYMAPERLRALADRAGGAGAFGRPPGPDDARAPATAARAAHVADIYALGMVMLEALSGRRPTEAAPAMEASAPGSRPARLAAAARAYAEARDRPPRGLVRDFEAATRRRIAPALRAILERCLDPDPAGRYRRALELAEDLDRWRTDRPLAYADEPFWAQAVPRWLRARRRGLSIASATILTLALAATAAVQVARDRMNRLELAARAASKLERKWDDPDEEAFLRSQRHAAPHGWTASDPNALEMTRRALLDYGLIGPVDDDAGGWRDRDDVRLLPEADRADLEAWLMERAYRYAAALGRSPGAPEDRQRALAVLERAAGGRAFRAFAALRDRLSGRPARRPSADGPAPRPAPEWLDEHLLGWAAECRPDAGDDADFEARRPAIERALSYYDRALDARPGSFWGHYRAATACFSLGRFSEAAHHLSRCLDRRPGNAMVRAHLARCLMAAGRYREALSESDRAVEDAPSFAEVYRTRARARLGGRQIGGLEEDLLQFETLRRVLPRSLWGGPGPAAPLVDAGLIGASFPDRLDGLAAGRGLAPRAEDPAPDREELEARANLAEDLRQAGLHPLAFSEYGKVLAIQPHHIPSRIAIPARTARAQQAILEGRFDDARIDLAVVLEDPDLESYVRRYPRTLIPLLDITRLLLSVHRLDEARWVVDQTRTLAIRCRRDVGRSHYHSAQVYAAIGASDAGAIETAAEHLFRAFVAHPDFLRWYRNPSPWFDPVRTRIDAALGRMEDPDTVRLRRMAAAGKPAR